jgi:hypothetical protein
MSANDIDADVQPLRAAPDTVVYPKFRGQTQVRDSTPRASAEVVAAAQVYMDKGYALVPAGADKRPLGLNWRRAWKSEEMHQALGGPCCAIGFLGGEFNNGIVPIDFDSEAGKAWWREQSKAAGINPDKYPTVVTPGKVQPDGKRIPGLHRYVLDVRGTLTNSAGKLKELGIDIRGKGHAVLPPSPHPQGGVYRWVPGYGLDDFPDGVPPCPDFLYDAIEEPQAKPAQPRATGNGHAMADI